VANIEVFTAKEALAYAKANGCVLMRKHIIEYKKKKEVYSVHFFDSDNVEQYYYIVRMLPVFGLTPIERGMWSADKFDVDVNI
jgi:hypothetical protein